MLFRQLLAKGLYWSALLGRGRKQSPRRLVNLCMHACTIHHNTELNLGKPSSLFYVEKENGFVGFPIEILALDTPTHSKSGFERPTSKLFFRFQQKRLALRNHMFLERAFSS